eukprot:4709134-Amphidinium_carterae.1
MLLLLVFLVISVLLSFCPGERLGRWRWYIFGSKHMNLALGSRCEHVVRHLNVLKARDSVSVPFFLFAFSDSSLIEDGWVEAGS